MYSFKNLFITHLDILWSPPSCWDVCSSELCGTWWTWPQWDCPGRNALRSTHLCSLRKPTMENQNTMKTLLEEMRKFWSAFSVGVCENSLTRMPTAYLPIGVLGYTVNKSEDVQGESPSLNNSGGPHMGSGSGVGARGIPKWTSLKMSGGSHVTSDWPMLS